MMLPEITHEEQTALDKALLDALDPLASAMRARVTGLPVERMWDADPVDVTLSVLTAWKVVDAEVKRLTAIAAGTAGSYGASYEQLSTVHREVAGHESGVRGGRDTQAGRRRVSMVK
ncbi:hypothetical protein ACIGW9_22950, partial [Streptomyces sp. NPDC053813]